jgi:general secretion pathway protein E
MVGEIRDFETAEIAIQAALTGHLVFSTLHTNDAAGAISRLLEMGVEDYLLASSLLGVLAQRLVRRVCPACKAEVPDGARSIPELASYGPDLKIYEGRGCEECAHTGYHGRNGIFEFLRVTDAIRQLILKRSSSDIIRDAGVREGMRTLREDGWRTVAAGITTVGEVVRVTQQEV